MPTRMLIDARHREETRVAVVQNNRIEEFDFESEEHKQLKGNIYLAKVTRVEPSLQAAFVDYGGNRHGFLAFSEIHPDYYQIPKEDRDKLLAEEVEQAKEEAELREEEDDEQAAEAASKEEDADVEETGDSDADEEHHEEPSVKNIRKRRMDLRRRYKIQDVIHRRQVLLVQVVKEERGNKGAALTTYLSLAGRYCVLMPNTSHGGGISRKISNASDRKRLKSIVDEMKLPETMGCIVRTAGMSRTKTEIKRDFTYLARLWDEIREATLKATAPEKIYTDSDLIKRAIRDIYNREIEEVLVEGDDGYKAAKDFMKLLMPSHARRVKHYADPTPLFQRYQVEDQLGAMYQPLVQLKSGGYLVINPTEALVSIDINSGRSTREHNIEQTALKTNIEAAREIARQLRLRDMAGLVVIDFIDMDHNSNNRKVEKALKDALKNDRARIQVGRISSFGLLEMSRQRLRTGVLEASTQECPHCGGTGLMRTVSSAGLSALRMLEEEAAKGKGSELTLACSRDAAVYVLNTKRRELGEIEEMYGVTISVVPDRELEGAAMNIEVGGPPPTKKVEMRPIELDEDDDIEVDVEDEEDESETETETDEEESRSRSRSRRRRGRRGGRNRRRDKEQDDATEDKAASAKSDESDGAGDSQKSEAGAENGDADSGEKKPRRRRRSRKADSNETEQTASGDKASDGDESVEAAEATEAAEEKPKRQRSRRTKKDEQPEAEAKDGTSDKAEEPEAAAKDDAKADDPKADDAEAKPKRRGRPPKAANGSKAPAKSDAGKAEAADAGDTPKAEDNATADLDAKPRRGWWQRTFGE